MGLGFSVRRVCSNDGEVRGILAIRSMWEFAWNPAGNAAWLRPISLLNNLKAAIRVAPARLSCPIPVYCNIAMTLRFLPSVPGYQYISGGIQPFCAAAPCYATEKDAAKPHPHELPFCWGSAWSSRLAVRLLRPLAASPLGSYRY